MRLKVCSILIVSYQPLSAPDRTPSRASRRRTAVPAVPASDDVTVRASRNGVERDTEHSATGYDFPARTEP